MDDSNRLDKYNVEITKGKKERRQRFKAYSSKKEMANLWGFVISCALAVLTVLFNNQQTRLCS